MRRTWLGLLLALALAWLPACGGDDGGGAAGDTGSGADTAADAISGLNGSMADGADE